MPPVRIGLYDQIYAIYQKIVGGETASSAKQDELRGNQGTGASYDPPTGGSGSFGWLSGIYKEIVSGIKLKIDGSDVSANNPLPTASSGCVIASNGVNVPVDSLQQTLAYTDGAVASISVTYLAVVYVQTYTYTAGNITSISQWVAQ